MTDDINLIVKFVGFWQGREWNENEKESLGMVENLYKVNGRINDFLIQEKELKLRVFQYSNTIIKQVTT